MNKRIVREGVCRFALVISMATAAAIPAAAHAQEEPVAQVARADDNVIYVSARRREENQQDVPLSVTAIGSELLENLRVTGAEDLEALEPTFSVSPASGYVNKNVYSLRGIRPTEAIYGQDPTVAIYLAEVVQSPAQGSNLGFYDLENVQILKGPQGTLFGRNTVGGAVLLTPRRPGEDFGFNAMVGVGEWGLFEAEAGIDIPVAPTFHVRFAGRLIESDGFQTNVGPGPFNGTKYGGESTRSVRATVVGDLNDRIQNTIMVTYDDKDANGRVQVLQAINPAGNALVRNYNLLFNNALSNALARAQARDIHEVETDIANYDNVEAWSATNTTVAELSDSLTFKSILNYREVDSQTQIDLDGTVERILHSEAQVANLDHHSVEMQLQGDTSRLDWVLGAFYYHEQGAEFSPGVFFPQFLAAINPIQQGARVNNTSYAVFAQGSYQLTDQLTATLGARMNWDKKKLTLLTKNGPNCALQVFNTATPNPTDRIRLPNDACSLPLQESFSQPTGTIAIDYKVTPDVLVYATSRLGYRSGGFNLRADEPVEYRPFQDETVIDVEGGVKADYFLGDIRMRTNVAVYNQWYSDIQRTVAVPNDSASPGSAVENAAKATVFGIEAQQMIRPLDWLTFDLSYAFAKPKFKEYVDPFSGVDLSSTPFVFTPRHAVNLRATVERPLAGDNGTLRFTANGSWQDEVWINALHTSVIIDQHPASVLPLLKQEAYWVFDFSAGWDNVMGSNFDLQAYVRNAFDREYKVGGIQLYTGASGYIAAAFGPPRQAGVQLRYQY